MARPAPRRRAAVVAATVLALSLAAGVVTAPSSVAHTATRSDGNDSPGRLDIRSASVAHSRGTVVHGVKTYEGWSASALGDDSFFIVEIDTNFDDDFERCAFIFYVGRLRGSLTNCGRNFIRTLPVSKPSSTTAKVKIPETVLPDAYRWVVFSFWTGAPTRCADLCFDAAPNRPPPILHDLTPPVVTMETEDLEVWEVSTTSSFAFPFSVSDAHTAVKSWTIQSSPIGSTTWTDVESGIGGGALSPTIVGTEGTRLRYRVVATDMHGNRAVGPVRRVYIPFDDDDLAANFSTPPTSQSDADAFGGSYSQMSSGTFTYTWTPGTDCSFALIGPGGGDWSVSVTADGGVPTVLVDESFDDAQRQTLYTDASCASTYVVTHVSGTFGLDAVMG